MASNTNVTITLPNYPYQILHPWPMISVLPYDPITLLVNILPNPYLGGGDIIYFVINHQLYVGQVGELEYFTGSMIVFRVSHTTSSFHFLALPIIWARLTPREERMRQHYLNYIF
jgi:hypothetical protein